LLFGNTSDGEQYSKIIDLLHQWTVESSYIADNIEMLNQKSQKIFLHLTYHWIENIRQHLLIQSDMLSNMDKTIPRPKLIENEIKMSFRHLNKYLKKQKQIPKIDYIKFHSLIESLYQLGGIIDKITNILWDDRVN